MGVIIPVWTMAELPAVTDRTTLIFLASKMPEQLTNDLFSL
jgi:hypothetical protein